MQSEIDQRVEDISEMSTQPNFAVPPKTQNSAIVTKASQLTPWQFKPGQVANPGGRPKRTPITDAYIAILKQLVPGDKHKRTYAEAIAQKMAEKAADGDTRAAQEITDRIEGKAMQRSELSGVDGAPMQFHSLSGRHEVEAKVFELFVVAAERAQAKIVGAHVEASGEDALVESKSMSDEPVSDPEPSNPVHQVTRKAAAPKQGKKRGRKPKAKPVPPEPVVIAKSIPKAKIAPPMEF